MSLLPPDGDSCIVVYIRNILKSQTIPDVKHPPNFHEPLTSANQICSVRAFTHGPHMAPNWPQWQHVVGVDSSHSRAPSKPPTCRAPCTGSQGGSSWFPKLTGWLMGKSTLVSLVQTKPILREPVQATFDP